MFSQRYPKPVVRVGGPNPVSTRNNPMPPPVLPASAVPPPSSTDDTWWTAPTQPLTQPGEDGEEGLEGSSFMSSGPNPYDSLWGRIVPCNPTLPVVDLGFDEPTITFGRNPENRVVANAVKISGLHCEIRLITEPDRTISMNITDLSSNGTYINGQKLGRGLHQRLFHGDEFSLGIPGISLDKDDWRFIVRRSSAPIQAGGGLHSQYQLGEVLGTGSFATVRKVWSKVTGETYAAKVIAKSRFAHNPKTKEMFERELSILQNLRHHNITRLVEYFEDESTIFIVMEFVAGGELLKYIQDQGRISEDQARIWASQMVDALSYTHHKNIAHRDLKPENILLSATEPKTIKIADFGLAKAVDAGTYLKTMCGTPAYLAPEVVLAGASMGYDSKVDCWSLGVIVWSMLTGVVCFVEDEDVPLRDRMATRQVSWELLKQAGISHVGIDFLKRLIVNEPHKRMSMSEARRHQWISTIANPAPPDFVGSQQSQSQHLASSQESREGTEPPPDRQNTEPDDFISNGLSHSAMENGSTWGEPRGGREPQSALSATSSRAFGLASGTSFSFSTPSPRPGGGLMLNECSQDLATLKLGNDQGMEEDGDDEEEDSEVSYVQPSIGTPPNHAFHQKESDMEVDGDSWQQIDAPTRTRKKAPPPPVVVPTPPRQARPVKGVPKSRGAAPAAAATPAQAPARLRGGKHVIPITIPPSVMKRKAADDFDDEDSPLSPVPSEPENTPAVAAKTIRKKRPDLANKSETNSSASTIRGSSRRASAETKKAPAAATPSTRLRNSTGAVANGTPTTSTRMSTRSRASAAAQPPPTPMSAKKRKSTTFRAPSEDSSDGEEEDVTVQATAKAGPSTRRTAAAPPPPKRITRKATGHPAAKAPRIH